MRNGIILNVPSGMHAVDPTPLASYEKDNFYTDLDSWINEASTESYSFGLENREVAANRIQEAYQQDAYELNLDGLNLRSLPASVGALKNLQILDLKLNNFSALPEAIGGLTNLVELKLSGNPLCKVPAQILKLGNLVHLQLDNTLLKTLPAEIKQLARLECLYIEENRLTSLPPEIGELKKLRILNLNYNKLSCLPKEMANLEVLLDLKVMGNSLYFRPEGLKKNLLDLPTIGEERDLGNRHLLNLVLQEKTQALLVYACEALHNDADWGVTNSSFINQLLQAKPTADVAGEASASIDELQKKLSEQFFAMTSIKAFAEESKDLICCDPEKNESLIFLDINGEKALSIVLSCYKKNIEGSDNLSDVNAPFTDGVLLHFRGKEAQFLGKNIMSELAPFPLISTSYKMIERKNCLPRLLGLLSLGVYQSQFVDALRTNAVSESTKKLVGLEHFEPLDHILSPLIMAKPESNNESTITEQHFADILTVTHTEADSCDTQAALLFCFSAVFAKYTSVSIFGTEGESPLPLRRYAAALLNKVIELDSSLLPVSEMINYKDRLLGRNGTGLASCTNTLTENMIGTVKGGGAISKAMFEIVFPQAWQ